jgi:hypothetical protein
MMVVRHFIRRPTNNNRLKEDEAIELEERWAARQNVKVDGVPVRPTASVAYSSASGSRGGLRNV